MNLKMLLDNQWIIFKALTGSHAYGTALDTSDKDYRGIFVLPFRKRVSLLNPIEEVGQEKPTDEKYYELRKYLELALDCNPNIIEYLFMPEDCILICEPTMKTLLAHRHLFISKRAYHTFSGYAYAQIKKAKGVNKWINNPKPEKPPEKEDFCFVIPMGVFAHPHFTPCRPIPLKQYQSDYPGTLDLSEFNVAGLEHVSNTYRLYKYGPHVKERGVFRGGNLVCESIPLEDEVARFFGLLIYNEHEYDKAMVDWKNYWTWRKERNPTRWLSQEKGEVDYDVKNMCHCMRLLLSGAAILQTGAPIIRFKGEQLQYLRDIRSGLFKYEDLLADVEKRMVELKQLYDASTIPHHPDRGAIDNLYWNMLTTAETKSTEHEPVQAANTTS